MTDNKIPALGPGDKRQLLKQLLEQKQKEYKAAFQGQGFVPPESFLQLKQAFESYGPKGMWDIYYKVSQGINTNATQIGQTQYINYSSYNYLGMSGDPKVSKASKAAIDRYGTSVSASRIASGERLVHQELEAGIAGFIGAEDCVVLTGGFSTNESVVGQLAGPDDLILYDSLIHASIQTGASLSGAVVKPFPHNRPDALEAMLRKERDKYKTVLVIIEGVYSMDGDIPDLPFFVRIKDEFQTLLMVDEAHSMGTLGATGGGIREYFGLNPNDVDIWMGTLSKSFASCGGYIAGSRELIEYLKFTTPGFVYSVGIPPSNAAAALAALTLLKEEPHRVQALQEKSDFFREKALAGGLDIGESHDSPVIPVILGKSSAAVALYRALYEKGILALPIMYPAVPDNSSRLRFFVSNLHTRDEIEKTIQIIVQELPKAMKE